MRVTRIIREHVEEQVKAKYREQYDELGKEYAEAHDKIAQQIEAIAAKAAADARAILHANPDWVPLGWKGEIISCKEIQNTAMRNRLTASRADLNGKIQKSIKNILITLEMGASKDELEELIRKA